MKKYEYMVVYNYPKGVGRCSIMTSYLINDYETVTEIDKVIQKENGIADALVTNLQLLREFEAEE